MNIPIFFITMVSVIIGVQIALKKGNNGYNDAVKDFLDKENMANSSIKKELDKSIIIKPDTSKLHYIDYEENEENKNIIKAQNIVKRKSELKMIHFPQQLTNTELKMIYGYNNLDKITMYEQHYNLYIHALADWAKLLIERENFNDAENILLSSIEFHSDLSLTYTLLADIYYNTTNTNKLNELNKLVSKSNIELKGKIIKHIEQLLSELEIK